VGSTDCGDRAAGRNCPAICKTKRAGALVKTETIDAPCCWLISLSEDGAMLTDRDWQTPIPTAPFSPAGRDLEISVAKLVGSRTGAVFRRSGLAVAPRFLWECLSSQTVNPFPAPATSHPACGFPALGAPVCFVSRVMRPIVLGRLSHLTIERAGSC
jgi:hypothetical protein